MLVTDVDTRLLVNELQLGDQLNECIHSQRRADFSLMLAMLCDDVRTQSQFTQPRTELTSLASTDEMLRAEFNLPKPAPLAIDNLQEINHFNQANLIHENQLAELRLGNALQPKPLAFRDNVKHVPHDVLTNTSLYCQHKHHTQLSEYNVKRLPFNAKSWLSAVQEAITKAPLLATA